MAKNIMEIKKSVIKELENPNTMFELIKTTFKGFKDGAVVQQAILEGRIRGFSLDDFLKKNIYAIPVWDSTTNSFTYMLVEAIANVRKIARRSGQTGKSDQKYVYGPEGEIISCSVTIYTKDGHENGFTSTVFFKEYEKPPKVSKGEKIPGMWQKMPHNMIAKVAEMHALRTAFPEELGQSYVEEEFDRERTIYVEDATDDNKVPTKEDNQIEFESTLNMLKQAKTVLPLKVYLDKKLPVSKYDDKQKAEIKDLIEKRIEELETKDANPT